MSRESRRARFAHLPTVAPKVGTLPVGQAELWPLLGDLPDDFVLYGGTGLALRLGHRASLDFDFFSASSFVPTDLVRELDWLGRVAINEAAPNLLNMTTEAGVNLAFFGDMRLQVVAEPSIVEANGVVIASLFDLAGTKAKAILDRSEWKDYVDLATILGAGLTLPEVLGYARTIFEPMFDFPVAVFLRALAWFGDGTAAEVPIEMQHELEQAATAARTTDIPVVAPYATTIRP